ncbi:hypothetical protein [Pseudophaeobacter sp.]|uniref:hypothetical protein n=1 Tax=Pseudophaeobacter sp. TaxID=1971739 RepID=UPI003298B80C
MRLEELTAFQLAEAEGRKRDAKRHVLTFVESFSDLDEKAVWVWENWQDLPENGGGRIRHELWEGLLLPVFHRAYVEGKLEAVVALAECHQNWISDPDFHSRFKVETDLDFWRLAYAMAPSDPRIRKGLLGTWLRVLDLIFHEWPSGLPGIDCSVWRQEVVELRSRIKRCRELDDAQKYHELFEYYEQIVVEFAQRMGSSETDAS